MTPLKAKFERERKKRPTHWLIVPSEYGRGGCRLRYIGPPGGNDEKTVR